MFRCQTAFALSLTVALGPTSAAFAQDQADLAKAAQNPVAAMISLPFQNNTFFGVGPDDDTANVLNIQPVIPINLGPVNLINRTIVPLIYLPDVTAGLLELPKGVSGGSTFGFGDINHSVYFSPADSGPVIWGIGPSISFPSATDEKLGAEKWSAGLSAVALVTPGPWVVGALVRQRWSIAGDDDRQDVSQMLIQPFVNYNLPEGWFLVSAPIITANWEADSDYTWLVPLGGGGRVFKIGPQLVNATLQAYYNVEQRSSALSGRCASRSPSCSRSEMMAVARSPPDPPLRLEGNEVEYPAVHRLDRWPRTGSEPCDGVNAG
jgi:hypothetical protein